ncbi:MAG: exodeoxyribonuclease VII large subunit [Bacteroidales bacterium]|jgi:exodeoxyribonuclease VII large subunit
MPEEIDNKTIFSLLEVTRSIQKTLSDRYSSPFWVKAEMSKLNFYSHSGHCYPEIIEKQEGKIIAHIRSNLWKDDYQAINEKFLQVLHEPLKDGIKILFLARISFDPVYGLALRIIDIDPEYTLGDLEKEKQETLRKLKKDGLFERNKSLKVPFLLQRIAIISVETSKGYADFLNVLETNPWNYKFFHFLFPSLLQGEKAVDSIINQLDRIKRVIDHFDAVAIIRGGGGDIGLSCFNNFDLAKEVCLFPIPVITGIGHTTNETVVEMISFSNAITPTKIAEYLIQKFHNFSVPVHNAEEKIIEKSQRIIAEEKVRLYSEIKLFISVSENILIENRDKVRGLLQKLHQQSLFLLRMQKEYLNNYLNNIKKGVITSCVSIDQELKHFSANLRKDTSYQLRQISLWLMGIEKNITNMNPLNVLKRGYSITLANRISVKSIGQVKENDQIETIVFDGKINSIVKSTKKQDK